MLKMQTIGYIGKDAVSQNYGGRNVINFNLAHSEKYKGQDGQPVDKTVWIDCSYWTDKTAILPYLKKGCQVYIEGTPEIKTYMSKDNKATGVLSCRVLSIYILTYAKTDDKTPSANNATNSFDMF